MAEKKPLKLHLGCGSDYLEGYVNIDLSAAQHTIAKPKTDLIADFRTLKYEDGTVDEIRCHHVFEHFTRAEALKLLLEWRRWLKIGGVLHIETPDFDTCCLHFMLSGSKTRAEIARHVFGSQEAAWANHYDGWGKRKYSFVLKNLGFIALTFKKRSNCLRFFV
jgi:predicted SAM-dependent methyltransferase